MRHTELWGLGGFGNEQGVVTTGGGRAPMELVRLKFLPTREEEKDGRKEQHTQWREAELEMIGMSQQAANLP